jgi:proline racemase
LSPANIPAFVKLGMEVKNELNKSLKIAHPEFPHMDKIEIVEFFDKPNHPEARERNVLIYGEGLVGRDPCGTGTCAKMATEVAKGKLGINEEYVGEGILGTIYRGRAVERAKVGKYDAIIPEITGRTFVVAFCNFVLDQRDPMPNGWLL